MSKIDNIDECIKSDKDDLSNYLSDESTDIIEFIKSDFPNIAKRYDITKQNLGQYIKADIYGKFMLSTRFGPEMKLEPLNNFRHVIEETLRISTRFRVFGMKIHKPSPEFDKDNTQLIYTMEEISELSFGGGHEMKTLVRIIYLLQRIIAHKHPKIKVGYISHKIVNGLFMNFPGQFPIGSFSTNVGINVIDLRLDCHLCDHNIRLMKEFKNDIYRIIRDEYDVIQTSILCGGNLFKRNKSKIDCKFEDVVGVYNHFVATDEITDKTYNHILNNAFMFMNILLYKNKKNSWEFHSLDTSEFHQFSKQEKSDVSKNKPIDKLQSDIGSKLDFLFSIINNNHRKLPKQYNDWNYVMIIENDQFDFKISRYINNTRVLLSNHGDKIEFRFYDRISNEVCDSVYSELIFKNNLMFITNGDKIIQTITKNKIIDIHVIPDGIIHCIILHMKFIDNIIVDIKDISIMTLFDVLMKHEVFSVNIIYIIMTYIESSLGNQFLKIISESIHD